jgi:hypothetical protein
MVAAWVPRLLGHGGTIDQVCDEHFMFNVRDLKDLVQ